MAEFATNLAEAMTAAQRRIVVRHSGGWDPRWVVVDSEGEKNHSVAGEGQVLATLDYRHAAEQEAERQRARFVLDTVSTFGADITDVWRQARENHETYSDTGDRENNIRFLTLGLTGEAGELANFVKKRWRDGDDHDDDIRKEIADVCAYAFMLADTMGLTPAGLIHTIAEKQQVFIAKMQARGEA